MIDAVVRAYRRWRCRRDFAGLSPAVQRAFTYCEIDPDSLIRRGLL